MEKVPAAMRKMVTGRERAMGCSTMKKVWMVYIDGTQTKQPQQM
jgi:hypothetical protein